jgi:hypothetical protein
MWKEWNRRRRKDDEEDKGKDGCRRREEGGLIQFGSAAELTRPKSSQPQPFLPPRVSSSNF